MDIPVQFSYNKPSNKQMILKKSLGFTHARPKQLYKIGTSNKTYSAACQQNTHSTLS